jgi:hypothetical protein
VPLDKNVLVDPLTHNIDVYLQPKSVKGWDDKANWVVIAIDSANRVQQVEIREIRADADGSMFSLVPAETSAQSPIATAAQLIIKFGPKTVVVYQIPKLPDPATGDTTVAPTSNKQTSDVYLNGSYSPGINSDPQYSIDGSLALMWDLSQQHLNYGQLGFLGSVKTDKRKKVDPDSYRLFLAYQNTPVKKFHGPLQGVLFTWLGAGLEFDRKGDNVNFITAPYLDFPIRVFPKTIRATTEPMAVLTPTIGIETGHNFHNAVTPNSGRAVFRSVVGATFLFRFNPKVPGFKGVELTNSYMLRLPAVREIYTLTEKVNGQDTDFPFLGRNPRHYLKSDVGLKVTDAFSLTFKHEYGALPPVFRKIDHKVSVGFTFSIRQLSGGVPTALRSK